MEPDKAVVCDASVVAAITFGEPSSPMAHRLIRERRLLGPTLLRYELAQVALRKRLDFPALAPSLEAAFVASLRLPIRLLEPSWLEVIELARTTRLTVYDACYLHLAQVFRVPLATLDLKLAQVAQDKGLLAMPTGA